MGDEKYVIPGAKTVHQMSATSPFYLSSGNQPGNLISHVIFSGENYVAWARAMTLSLRAEEVCIYRWFGCEADRIE